MTTRADYESVYLVFRRGPYDAAALKTCRTLFERQHVLAASIVPAGVAGSDGRWPHSYPWCEVYAASFTGWGVGPLLAGPSFWLAQEAPSRCS